jgi:hypothetical protein
MRLRKVTRYERHFTAAEIAPVLRMPPGSRIEVRSVRDDDGICRQEIFLVHEEIEIAEAERAT